jgi:hypothetical protein
MPARAEIFGGAPYAMHDVVRAELAVSGLPRRFPECHLNVRLFSA